MTKKEKKWSIHNISITCTIENWQQKTIWKKWFTLFSFHWTHFYPIHIQPIFTPSVSSFPQIFMLIEVQILFVLLGMIKHSSQNEHSWCVMIWSFMSLIYATAWSLSDRFILTSYLNTVKVMEKVWKKGLPNLNELNITAKLFWWLIPVLFFFWFE